MSKHAEKRSLIFFGNLNSLIINSNRVSTLSELALLLGLNQSSLYQSKSRITIPKLEVVSACASFFNVSIDEIIHDSMFDSKNIFIKKQIIIYSGENFKKIGVEITNSLAYGDIAIKMKSDNDDFDNIYYYLEKSQKYNDFDEVIIKNENVCIFRVIRLIEGIIYLAPPERLSNLSELNDRKILGRVKKTVYTLN
jgi:hypothetical protein